MTQLDLHYLPLPNTFNTTKSLIDRDGDNEPNDKLLLIDERPSMETEAEAFISTSRNIARKRMKHKLVNRKDTLTNFLRLWRKPYHLIDESVKRSLASFKVLL